MWPHPYPEGHDLNNLESTIPQEASTKVSSLLAKWFLRRRFLKIVPVHYNIKLWLSFVTPPLPRRSCFEQFRIYTYSRSFHISFSSSSPVVLEIKFNVKFWSPIVAPPLPRGSWFEQFRIYNSSRSFHKSFISSGQVVLEKKIFKDCSCTLQYKTLTLFCDPTLTPAVMLWTI